MRSAGQAGWQRWGRVHACRLDPAAWPPLAPHHPKCLPACLSRAGTALGEVEEVWQQLRWGPYSLMTVEAKAVRLALALPGANPFCAAAAVALRVSAGGACMRASCLTRCLAAVSRGCPTAPCRLTCCRLSELPHVLPAPPHPSSPLQNIDHKPTTQRFTRGRQARPLLGTSTYDLVWELQEAGVCSLEALERCEQFQALSSPLQYQVAVQLLELHTPRPVFDPTQVNIGRGGAECGWWVGRWLTAEPLPCARRRRGCMRPAHVLPAVVTAPPCCSGSTSCGPSLRCRMRAWPCLTAWAWAAQRRRAPVAVLPCRVL